MNYLYLKDRVNNIDNRPVVAVIEGVSVPQYPIKASEIDKLFSEIDNYCVLDDLSVTIREAVDDQQKTFKKIACDKYGVIYNSSVLVDMEDQRLQTAQPGRPHIDLYRALWGEYYRSYYDIDTKIVIDDLWGMYNAWRALKIKEVYPKVSKGISAGVFYVDDSALLYISADYDRLYAYDKWTGDPAEESSLGYSVADNITDVTQCVWESLQKHLGIYSGSYGSFEDWAVDQKDTNTIADVVSEMLWGFKGCVMIKEIAEL